MRYLWFVLEYNCPSGHHNALNLYVEEPPGGVNDQMILARMPQAVSCSTCPSGTRSSPSSTVNAAVEVRTHVLTEEQFKELGLKQSPGMYQCSSRNDTSVCDTHFRKRVLSRLPHWRLEIVATAIVRLDPTSPHALAGVALSQFKHGQEEEAVSTYEKALIYDRRFADSKFLESDKARSGPVNSYKTLSCRWPRCPSQTSPSVQEGWQRRIMLSSIASPP
jgi:hypothetical protein